MGTGSESGGSHPIFCRPGFLFLQFRFRSLTFRGPRCLATNDTNYHANAVITRLSTWLSPASGKFIT